MRREEKSSTPLVLLGRFGKLHSVDWEVRFQQLVEYKRVHGDCNVPQEYKAESTTRDVGQHTTNKEGDNE